MNKILRIQTFGLVPHEKNPRKVLGDLEELTASIKQSGIHQPLTVVETDTPGVYKVIMGHRRLQAAINAGYDSVPCIVVEMTEEEQLVAMLVENMQRSDLTVLEQAVGIQQTIDFGITVEEIAKKTGFSRSTVRSRVKLLDLDRKKVERATNATIEEFMLIEQFEDLETRNKLMDYVGTHNLNLQVEKEKTKLDNLSKNNTTSTELPVEKKETKNDNTSIYKKLRIKFMSDLFKQKISKEIHAQTLYQNSIILLNGSFSIKGNDKVFKEITQLNSIDLDDALLKAVHKNKIAYFVAATYSMLENTGDINLIYAYLEEVGYVISDEETEYINNVEN